MSLIKPWLHWMETPDRRVRAVRRWKTPPDAVPRSRPHLRPIPSLWLVVPSSGGLPGRRESSLFLRSAGCVDLMDGSTPERICCGTKRAFARAASSSIVRPSVHVSTTPVINQIVVPQLTNRIRWRTHLYTLGHALNYFQSDFAGRLANRITQVGPAVRGVRSSPRRRGVRHGVRPGGRRRVRAREPVACAADGGLDRMLRRADVVFRAGGAEAVGSRSPRIAPPARPASWTATPTSRPSSFSRAGTASSAVRDAHRAGTLLSSQHAALSH